MLGYCHVISHVTRCNFVPDVSNCVLKVFAVGSLSCAGETRTSMLPEVVEKDVGCCLMLPCYGTLTCNESEIA